MGYLCLTRRPGESLILYDSDDKPIGAIQVTRCRAADCRIAFDMPGVRIVRAELTDIRIGGQKNEQCD
jgi:sRNA-binding carbon storage regulator CsrA